MAKSTRNGQKAKGQFRPAYLVRPCICLPLGEAEGYFLSLAEAERALRQLEEQYPEETFLIEEYQSLDQTAPNLVWFPRHPEQ